MCDELTRTLTVHHPHHPIPPLPAGRLQAAAKFEKVLEAMPEDPGTLQNYTQVCHYITDTWQTMI